MTGNFGRNSGDRLVAASARVYIPQACPAQKATKTGVPVCRQAGTRRIVAFAICCPSRSGRCWPRSLWQRLRPRLPMRHRTVCHLACE